jgi:hypothetical protein
MRFLALLLVECSSLREAKLHIGNFKGRDEGSPRNYRKMKQKCLDRKLSVWGGGVGFIYLKYSITRHLNDIITCILVQRPLETSSRAAENKLYFNYTRGTGSDVLNFLIRKN